MSSGSRGRVRIGPVDGGSEENPGVAASLTAGPTGPQPPDIAGVGGRHRPRWGAVHHDVLHPDRLVGGEALGAGREVAHPPPGPGATVAGSKPATSAHIPGRGCRGRRSRSVGCARDCGRPAPSARTPVAHPVAEQVGACGTSHSWPACAPLWRGRARRGPAPGDRRPPPRRRWRSRYVPATRVRVAKREVEQGGRFRATLGGDVDELPVDEVGVHFALADGVGVPAESRALTLQPLIIHSHAGRRRPECARQSTRVLSAAKCSLTTSGYGESRVNWKSAAAASPAATPRSHAPTRPGSPRSPGGGTQVGDVEDARPT